MSIAEGAGDAPYWKLDSPEILSDDAQDLTRVGSKVGSFHKYMTSGSARKRQVKEKNCNFCIKELEGDTLDNHLKLSERCRMLYSRKLRVIKLRLGRSTCVAYVQEWDMSRTHLANCFPKLPIVKWGGVTAILTLKLPNV